MKGQQTWTSVTLLVVENFAKDFTPQLRSSHRTSFGSFGVDPSNSATSTTETTFSAALFPKEFGVFEVTTGATASTFEADTNFGSFVLDASHPPTSMSSKDLLIGVTSESATPTLSLLSESTPSIVRTNFERYKWLEQTDLNKL